MSLNVYPAAHVRLVRNVNAEPHSNINACYFLQRYTCGECFYARDDSVEPYKKRQRQNTSACTACMPAATQPKAPCQDRALEIEARPAMQGEAPARGPRMPKQVANNCPCVQHDESQT